MSLADARTEVFIVRIRLEPREDESSEMIWRGRVEHLGTKQVRHFRDMATLVSFLTGHGGIGDERS